MYITKTVDLKALGYQECNMASLTTRIELYLDRKVEFNKDIVVQDDADGRGLYIARWDDSVEKSQPTEEQLNVFEAEATRIENNNSVIFRRKDLYGTSAEQFEYIVENGVSAFIEKQNQIKTNNPKS